MVLQFVPREARAECRQRSEPCQIVVLPCIRYERWSEPERAKPAPQKKKSRKRRARSR
jgi:hypothetical protein